jgi:hypothetical protein
MGKLNDLTGRVKRFLLPVLAMIMASAGVLGLSAAPAHATPTTQGYGCGYYSNVSLFGGPYGSMGCGTQTSPDANANSAAVSTTWNGTTQYVNDANGVKAQYGPADMLSSPWLVGDVTANTGAMTVTSQGSSSIQVTAKAVGVGPSPFYTSTPNGADNPGSPAGYVQTTCTASGPTTYSGSTTIDKGHVDTKLDANGYPVNTVSLPVPLPQNYRVDYTIDNIPGGEHGHLIFNERIYNSADGSYTVNGSHMYEEGPTALGDVIIAQSKCGHA